MTDSNAYEDLPLVFSFSWMTHNARYDLKALKKMKGSASKPLENLLDFLVHLSSLSWNDLADRSKFKGGYEVLPLAEMKNSIIDGVPAEQTAGLLGLIVFRFNKEADRLIALRTGNTLHVLGFDLDHSLYNHGS